MDTWTLQKGYPVVDISRPSPIRLLVKQRWFLLNPNNRAQNNPNEYNKYRWFVPVTTTTRDELDFKFEKRPVWLTNETIESNLLEKF